MVSAASRRPQRSNCSSQSSCCPPVGSNACGKRTDGQDGPEGAKLTSRLEVVDLGFDDEGDEISSCVIVPVMPAVGEMAATPRAWDRAAKPPKGPVKIAHEALFEVNRRQRRHPAARPAHPAGPEMRTLRRGICASINDRSKQRAFERAVAALIAGHNEYAWVISI
jgi:hypothetical protein